ncbi:hypothetical protein CMI37_15240 [Candidatus Pacearchaeota archaeon]|nr:hypothetical protein [Candidatus Pacearchaeota archaeon]
MRTLNKDSYWWKGQEKEWAAQDKSGNWWIYKEDKKPSMKIKKKTKEGSSRLTTQEYIMVALASALGVSLALNIIALIS